MIDYFTASERYRPPSITTLLVGEAPPPNGRKYFYVPGKLRAAPSIELNRSLPATIFHHYFARLPADPAEYTAMLEDLTALGVFLVDLCDEPVRVRGSADGLRRIRKEIPTFRQRLRDRGIEVEEERMVFLLARSSYRADLRLHFPKAAFRTWLDFRLDTAGGQPDTRLEGREPRRGRA